MNNNNKNNKNNKNINARYNIVDTLPYNEKSIAYC